MSICWNLVLVQDPRPHLIDPDSASRSCLADRLDWPPLPGLRDASVTTYHHYRFLVLLLPLPGPTYLTPLHRQNTVWSIFVEMCNLSADI